MLEFLANRLLFAPAKQLFRRCVEERNVPFEIACEDAFSEAASPRTGEVQLMVGEFFRMMSLERNRELVGDGIDEHDIRFIE